MTYNYTKHWYATLPIPEGENIQEWLSGKRADDVLPALEAAVVTLGTERDRDYWASTPGNAGAVLARLVS